MNEDFRARINRFVRTILRGYAPTGRGKKIIHDPIWGSVVFHPWEVRLIDSPLFQRLRNVNQVGLADSTYPAARHTRFEHSLGTMAVAARMMEQLYDDARTRKEVRHVIGEGEIHLVRLAALLHDVGHCPYSHLSEAVYGRMPEFAAIREEVLAEAGQPVSPSPHEIFSYLIITSDAFVNFFWKHINNYPGIKTRTDARDLLRRAANIVIGAVNGTDDGVQYSYLTHVINGNFDADKLDYTQRDSYTSGIALTYGVERFLLKLVICRTEKDGITDYRLGITADALSTVEELIFNRSMLYHYMYRHQKILAAEAQMRDAIYALVRVGQIKHPCDFLFLNNQELSALYHSRKIPFAAEGAKTKTLEKIMANFARRTLWKRALELSADSFGEEPADLALDSTLKEMQRIDNPEEQKALLREFAETWPRRTLYPEHIARYVEFMKRCSIEDLIAERKEIAGRLEAAYRARGKKIDFDPLDFALSFQPPLESDLRLTIVDKQRREIPANEAIDRIKQWTEAFNRSKWRGYLFVAPHVDRKLAGEVFAEYLKEK